MPRAYIFLATGTESCGSVEKTTAEQFRVGVDFRALLRRSGATLTSGTITATDLSDGSSASAMLLSPTASTESLPTGLAEVTLKANTGTAGHRYKVLFAVRDSRNEIFHEAIMLLVRA